MIIRKDDIVINFNHVTDMRIQEKKIQFYFSSLNNMSEFDYEDEEDEFEIRNHFRYILEAYSANERFLNL